ncbi:hypothetical protein CMV_027558 [Castanea mollissima]|uniref:Uncharacterized protein n=1 Tax=Castanea mollissima TaxID=60419 RepID=A0A8J4QHU9_9ROSI|nr:hypothetical protein CMV_027558 [Castanea mollissima]
MHTRHAAKAKACTSHAAKAKACTQGTQPRPRQPLWACCQGQGMHKPRGQGSPHGHAAKAKAAPMGMQPRPRHAQATQPRPRHAQATHPTNNPHFFGNHSKFVGKPRSQGQGSPHGRVAKAKACSQGMDKPRSPRQGQGQGSPHGRAAKAKACSSQGQGSAHGRAAKAKACTGHAAHAKAKACSAKAKAAPMGVLPRPRHAQATQPRSRQPPWACCQGQGIIRVFKEATVLDKKKKENENHNNKFVFLDSYFIV